MKDLKGFLGRNVVVFIPKGTDSTTVLNQYLHSQNINPNDLLTLVRYKEDMITGYRANELLLESVLNTMKKESWVQIEIYVISKLTSEVERVTPVFFAGRRSTAAKIREDVKRGKKLRIALIASSVKKDVSAKN